MNDAGLGRGLTRVVFVPACGAQKTLAEHAAATAAASAPDSGGGSSSPVAQSSQVATLSAELQRVLGELAKAQALAVRRGTELERQRQQSTGEAAVCASQPASRPPD
jgi:hypothetical protein